jgi:nitronate monooxygenase
MAYIGTPFIATPESMASPAYKEALASAGADDIVKTDAVTGIPANFLKSSLLAQGILQADGSLLPKGSSDLASWKTAWSAGQGVASVGAVETVARRVETLHQEWLQATEGVAR